MTTPGTSFTVECRIHFKHGCKGRKRMQEGPAPAEAQVPVGNIPRVARLMALAIRFDDLIRTGQIRDYADIARLGHVTRARATQIMNLLHLAPDIQEEILFLPRTEKGYDPVCERHVRAVAAVVGWAKQRQVWKHMLKGSPSAS